MKIFITLFATIFFVTTSFSQGKISSKKIQKSKAVSVSTTSLATTAKTDKELAKDFSMKIVKSYFSNNSSIYYNSLSTNIYKLQDNKMQAKTESKTWIESNFSKINRDNKTFADYKKSYKIEILSKKDLQNDARFKSHMNFDKITDKDYLFIGRETKANVSSFVWDDFLMFIVRKTGKGWEISATL